jgi:hypothetical protein
VSGGEYRDYVTAREEELSKQERGGEMDLLSFITWFKEYTRNLSINRRNEESVLFSATNCLSAASEQQETYAAIPTGDGCSKYLFSNGNDMSGSG